MGGTYWWWYQVLLVIWLSRSAIDNHSLNDWVVISSRRSDLSCSLTCCTGTRHHSLIVQISIKQIFWGKIIACLKMAKVFHWKLKIYRFLYDVTKCFFNINNASEKQRISEFDCHQEVVTDMFAGRIRYFWK